MPKMTILENEFATLLYYPEEKIVQHVFHKQIGGVYFREVLDKGADLLKKYGASKWLSDDQANSALSPEDAEWSKTDWFPRVLDNGWKYWALVVPRDMAGRMNMKQFVDEYFERGLQVMVFTSPEKAMQWLKSVG
jgi:hypothetical protein